MLKVALTKPKHPITFELLYLPLNWAFGGLATNATRDKTNDENLPHACILKEFNKSNLTM